MDELMCGCKIIIHYYIDVIELQAHEPNEIDRVLFLSTSRVFFALIRHFYVT